MHLLLKSLPAVGVLLVGAILLIRQNRALSLLEREAAKLRPVAEEARSLRAEIAQAPSITPDTNELRRLRAEKLELLRLRGEIGDLRRQASLAPVSMEQEITKARESAQTATHAAELARARRAAEDLRRETLQTAANVISYWKAAAVRAQGAIPASWDEVRRLLKIPWRSQPSQTDEQIASFREALVQGFEELTSDTVPPTAFDILPHSEPFDPWNPASHAQVLILRERQPRALPDGGWARTYVFLDGHLAEVTSDTGDFSAWEREATSRGSPSAGPR